MPQEQLKEVQEPEIITYERVADQKRLQFITDVVADRINNGGKILDVGCGNGIISIHLGKQGFNVTGIDVSEKTIETARNNNPFPNVRFRVQSAEELEASGELFDVIVCSEVLEHLHDPGALLSVLNASLKEDGILVVTVPNGKGPREALVTKPILRMQKNDGFLWKMVSKIKKTLGYSGTTVQSQADNLDHVQFFTRKDLRKLSAKHNFKIVKFAKSNFIEDVFPFSFFAKRIKFLQRLDCKIADILPYAFTGGFFSVWKKTN